MFILRNKEQIERALERARNITPKLKLKVVRFGYYLVQSEADRDSWYNVKCGRLVTNEKFVDCECKAGSCHKECKHAAVAIGVHMMMAEARQKRELEAERRIINTLIKTSLASV